MTAHLENIDPVAVAALPAAWYAAREIPPALITDLGKVPLVSEWLIERAFRVNKGNVRQPAFGGARLGEIASLAAMGLADKEVAAHLSITEHTVKTHKRRLLCALRARNATQAVASAIALGYIYPVMGGLLEEAA